MGVQAGPELALKALLYERMVVHTENNNLVAATFVTVALLSACTIIGHLLHTNRWVNESITALMLGLGAGTVVFLTTSGRNSHLLEFDEDLFFYYLLPPIIFNAGFQVKKKQFFQNFITIVLFGVIGVFISFTIITLGCCLIFPKIGLPLSFKNYMALGVIFSATDSVCTLQVLHQDETPLLYSLVFGEGVMNDASSIVLFNAVEDLDFSEIDASKVFMLLGRFLYLFLTSTILGVAVGLASAYGIKKLYFGRHSTNREFAVMILMAYLSYILSELLNLSGILTVFFCGILMSHYTWHNVTESSRISTRHSFATMSFVAEIFIFLYVGMDALDKSKWELTNVSPSTSISLSAALIFLITLGRAAFVFPLSMFSNCVGRTPGARISFRHQVIIWWAGLMRGAVSIALAYKQFTSSGTTYSPTNATAITTTIIVVLFSTVVFGMFTKPLVEWLIPHHVRLAGDSSGPSSPKHLFDIAESNVPQSARSSSLHMLLTSPVSTVHYFWRRFDDAYMRPVFRGMDFDNDRQFQVEDSPTADLP